MNDGNGDFIMRTYSVYTTSYSQGCDRPWRGKIRTFIVADWTREEVDTSYSGDLREARPPLAIFEVGGIHDEDLQRMLSNKLCDAVNKMNEARNAIEASL